VTTQAISSKRLGANMASQRYGANVRSKIGYLATFLSASAALTILGAPIAAASPKPAPAPIQPSCAASASGTICQSPGNAQINDAPPPVHFYPYGGEAFLL
jgi:hypothetical protein